MVWKVADALVLSGMASFVLGVVIAGLLGYVVTRENIGEPIPLQLIWTIGLSASGILLGVGLTMTITGLALDWTTRKMPSTEEWSEPEREDEMEDE